MQKTIAFSFFILFFLCCFLRCVPEPKLKLNRAMRVEVDSLYKKQIPALTATVDSLCALEKKAIIAHAVDSIMQQRLKERKKQLGY